MPQWLSAVISVTTSTASYTTILTQWTNCTLCCYDTVRSKLCRLSCSFMPFIVYYLMALNSCVLNIHDGSTVFSLAIHEYNDWDCHVIKWIMQMLIVVSSAFMYMCDVWTHVFRMTTFLIRFLMTNWMTKCCLLRMFT